MAVRESVLGIARALAAFSGREQQGFDQSPPSAGQASAMRGPNIVLAGFFHMICALLGVTLRSKLLASHVAVVGAWLECGAVPGQGPQVDLGYRMRPEAERYTNARDGREALRASSANMAERSCVRYTLNKLSCELFRELDFSGT